MPEDVPAPGDPTPADPERRLADARADAPELAAALSPRPPRRGRAFASASIAALVLLAAAASVALFRRSAPAGGDGERLAPLEGVRDAATGEEVAPFQGFALRVETEPPGARVTIAGVLRGEAPVLAGLDCAPGDPIEIRAEARGHRARATVRCRADALVTLTLRLGK